MIEQSYGFIPTLTPSEYESGRNAGIENMKRVEAEKRELEAVSTSSDNENVPQNELFNLEILNALGRCAGVNPNIMTVRTKKEAGPAKRICEGCPIKEPCLEYALKNNESGVWGGTVDGERRKIKRARNQAQKNNPTQ